MRQDQLHSLPGLRLECALLRNNQTPAEEELWRLLRKHKLGGRKLRRQHSIGSYIVDFYCAAEELVIEVDGSVHDTAESVARDDEAEGLEPEGSVHDTAESVAKVRDERLQHLGYKIIRIRNSEVFEEPQAVLQRIAADFGTT